MKVVLESNDPRAQRRRRVGVTGVIGPIAECGALLTASAPTPPAEIRAALMDFDYRGPFLDEFRE